MTTPTIERWLNRGQIVIGELQPRKHFPEGKVAELAESLKAHGFDPGISRLLVRPIGEVKIEHEEDSKHWFVRRRTEGTEGTQGWETVETADSAEDAEKKRLEAALFELVIGECRYRASEIAEIRLLPAAIQAMDDLTALQKQLVENMQRSELTPMEEAMAFARMREMGQTPEEIGKSLGLGKEVVRNRLLLCRLFGTDVAEAIERGDITATHGLALGRVPSRALRTELLQKIFVPPDGSAAPWSEDSLLAHIKLDYVTDLRFAKFDQEDPQLVLVEFDEGHEFENEHRKWGGACTDCPFNTFVNPPADGGERRSAKDTRKLCTNPQCFQMKEIAAHERWRAGIVEHALAEEIEVITLSHAENAELWNESGRALAFHSPYVELFEVPATSELRSDVVVGDLLKTWKILIDGQAVPIVLGRDTAGKVHELVRHELAKKAAHLNGHKIFRDSGHQEKLDEERSAAAQGSGVTSAERSQSETLAAKAEQDRQREILNAEIAAIVEAAEGKECRGQFRLPKAFYQQLLFTLLSLGESFDTVGADSITAAVMSRRGLALEEASVTGLTIGQQFGLAVEMLVALEEEGKESWASVFGVDIKATRRKAEKKAAHTRRGGQAAVAKDTKLKEAA